MVVLRAVDLGDRDLRRVLIGALPALGRLLHFAHLALGGRVHYTVYVRHLCALSTLFGLLSLSSRCDAIPPDRLNQLRFDCRTSTGPLSRGKRGAGGGGGGTEKENEESEGGRKIKRKVREW